MILSLYKSQQKKKDRIGKGQKTQKRRFQWIIAPNHNNFLKAHQD